MTFARPRQRSRNRCRANCSTWDFSQLDRELLRDGWRAGQTWVDGQVTDRREVHNAIATIPQPPPSPTTIEIALNAIESIAPYRVMLAMSLLAWRCRPGAAQGLRSTTPRALSQDSPVDFPVEAVVFILVVVPDFQATVVVRQDADRPQVMVTA